MNMLESEKEKELEMDDKDEEIICRGGISTISQLYSLFFNIL